ncbi:MAG TPA: hypothetical protein VIN11_02015 [Roseivirga sp.]
MSKDFTYLEKFINEIDVVCPKCSKKAIVRSNPNNRARTQMICLQCGTSKQWEGESNIIMSSTKFDLPGILMGQPVDCYFQLPLWFVTDFKEHQLFAYNLEHLKFLKNYIQDPLRERKENEHGWSNRSLESRLPKWMLSAKNRESLLKKIKGLEAKSN